MRRIFANDILRNELYHQFTLQTKMRDEVKQEARDRLEELYEASQTDSFYSSEMYHLIKKLALQLKNHQGKMLYGYLPKPIKETVDAIVAELAKDNRIADFYAEWNRINREKLSTYYDKPKPDIPLEDNKEFRSIKNAVIKAVVHMTKQTEQSAAPSVMSSTVTGLISLLGRLLSISCQKHRTKLSGQIDAKLKSKIDEKKQAHGLKTDHRVTESTVEDEEQDFGIFM